MFQALEKALDFRYDTPTGTALTSTLMVQHKIRFSVPGRFETQPSITRFERGNQDWQGPVISSSP